MQFQHPAHPGRDVRLGYCLNLEPADEIEKLIGVLRAISIPLRQRLSPRAPFGVGLHLPQRLARSLASPRGERDLYRLQRTCETEGLDPFTQNAFPYEGFGAAGLKAGVFRPSWAEEKRLEYTVAVARAAVALLRRVRGGVGEHAHLSISTHTGGWGAAAPKKREHAEFALNQARALDELVNLHDQDGTRAILALEPEPGANAGDLAALDQYFAFARPRAIALLEEERNRDSARAPQLFERHLGTCLDACHAAVEGEVEDAVDALVTGRRKGPAKLQYSSALRVADPGRNAAGIAALLALEEPRYLHQVRGFGGGAKLAVDDLPALREELAGERRAAWLACEAWTCHFHVPVDLASAGSGLATTRADADRLLEILLADPARWSTTELHVEIETYTWEALPGWVRGRDALVDGIEREYRHVLGVMERAGWRPAS